jgi:hypothetical protein
MSNIVFLFFLYLSLYLYLHLSILISRLILLDSILKVGPYITVI